MNDALRADDPRIDSIGDLASPWSRRWLPVVALASLLLFAAVAGALAWRQYRDDQRTALSDARARAVVAARVFDTYFGGEISTLSSIAKAPVVVDRDETGMLAYFKRVQPPKGPLFTGGLAWVDLTGTVRLTTNDAQPGAIADVTDRSYYTAVKRTGKPYVSEGIVGRQSHVGVVVVAVPTTGPDGKLAGILIGTLQIKPTQTNTGSIDLGYAGLQIFDRKGQSVLDGFTKPRNLAALARFGKASSGVLSDTAGLDGHSGHVLAFAQSPVPQWTVVLDRPRSELFSAARHSLELELAIIGAVALADLALLAWFLVRARSEAYALRTASRARLMRYEAEHQVAMTLQRSLLTEIPAIDGIDSAARYQAGVTGHEVGGDWYDVVPRPDGIVHFTVGDVAGHGIAAAALMGQLRNAFRAYAYDQTSPAAILRRLLRHMARGEMATAICMTFDPLTRELTYASAGHPPPLMRDDETGKITQFEFAQAPPLGFAAPDNVRESRLAVPRRATIVAYTDGVVERRDQPIDRGIGRLAAALRESSVELTAAALADRLVREVAVVTAASDDVALLVLRIGEEASPHARAPRTASSAPSA